MSTNWIKLPDGGVINSNLVTAVRITEISNPSRMFQVMAFFQGGGQPLATELRSREAAQKIVDAFLQAAGAGVKELPTKYEG